jgi:plastocyanin
MATNNLEEPPYLRPGSGRVVRQTGPGSLEPVVTDIEYPVYLGFGPDGALYLTYPAFAPNAGAQQGALLRIDLSAGTPISLAGLGELGPSCQGGPGRMAGLATPAAVGEPGAEETVAIEGFAFSPDALTVAVGTTVTWTNRDEAPHTVAAGAGAFDSGRLDQGGTFQRTFDEPGTYAYVCAFHPTMTGSVVVG